MQAANLSLPSVAGATRDPNSDTRSLLWWHLALAALLFGLRLEYSAGRDGTITVTLASLAPVAAAWAVHRHGPRLVAPLVVLTLLPAFSFSAFPQLTLSFSPVPFSFVLLGVLVGALMASAVDRTTWSGLVRHTRTGLLLVTFALLLLARFEWPAHYISNAGFGGGLTLDPVAAVVGLLLLSVVNWRALAAHGGGATVRWLLPTALLMAFAVRTSVYLGPLGLRWGAVWAYGAATVIFLIGLLSGVRGRRSWLGAAAAILVIEAMRLHFGLSSLAGLFRVSTYPEGLAQLGGAACDLASLAILGMVAGRSATSRMSTDTGFRLWFALAAVLALQLVVGPFAEPWRGMFTSLTVTGWIIGAVAYIVAFVRGARGFLAAPVILAAIAVAAPALQDDLRHPMAVGAHGVGIAALAAMYGFVGMLHRRASRADSAEILSAAGPIDITRLAHFVGRLDTSATLRSFGALAVVLGVGAALLQTGAMTWFVQSFRDPDRLDAEEILLAWALVLPLILAPLSFIAFDAIARNDTLRPLSALSGAAWGAVGASGGVVVLGTLALVPGVMTQWGVLPVIGTMLLIVVLVGVQMLSRSSRMLISTATILLAIVAVGLFVIALVSARDDWGNVPLGALGVAAAQIIAIGSFLVLVGRGVRLRADLSCDVPRGLLYGEIRPGGFWARLACLMGTPASMWNSSSLRDPAFWTLLFARPLVYAGAIGMWGGYLTAGALTMGAAHAVFAGGKRLAARNIWRPEFEVAAPVLFLRSFEDDQFDLTGRLRGPWRRWIALWSYRRNIDEMLVDEVARYGPVVALGRPGEKRIPFGAERYYSTHDDWQRIITQTARRAHAIVVVAGDTPGVRWEYELLAREGLLAQTVLLFRPGAESRATNRAALNAFPLTEKQRAGLTDNDDSAWIALLHLDGRPVLLRAEKAEPSAYVLALRAHFQKRGSDLLARAAQAAPPILSLRDLARPS